VPLATETLQQQQCLSLSASPTPRCIEVEGADRFHWLLVPPFGRLRVPEIVVR
jgi:hypothetical protein